MSEYLDLADSAARAAGILLREDYGSALEVNEMLEYDIKLDLDVRSQELITDHILNTFPDHAIYGEEGIGGNQESPYQWIVDPIDGTVNYANGVPYYAVNIGLQQGDEMVLAIEDQNAGMQIGDQHEFSLNVDVCGEGDRERCIDREVAIFFDAGIEVFVRRTRLFEFIDALHHRERFAVE